MTTAVNHQAGITLCGVQEEPTRLVIAHLADPHLDGSEEAEERFAAVVRHLAARRQHIDLVVVTGDIVEARDVANPAKALATARQQLAIVAPSVLSPGNSDDSSAFEPSPRFVARHRHLHVISLDSSVPGEIGGRLNQDDVRWLTDTLSQLGSDEIAILAMHHPPMPLGHPVVDNWRAHGATAELERVIAATPAVLATLVGHTHSATWTTFGGRPLIVAPGIHSAGRSRLDALIGEDALIDTAASPAYLLHTVEGRRLISQHIPIAMGS